MTGIIVITKPGAVIDGWDVELGRIDIAAANVTVENTRIVTDAFYGIHVIAGNGASVVITDTTIVGTDKPKNRCDVGINGSHYVAQRVDVSGCSDGFHVSASDKVLDSYFHNPYFTSTSHNDAVQAFSGAGLVISHNTFNMGFAHAGEGSNSCIFLTSHSGALNGATVSDNLLNGGGYTVYVEQSSSVIVTNNRIGRGYTFGWYSHAHDTNTPTMSGNVFDDTGLAT